MSNRFAEGTCKKCDCDRSVIVSIIFCYRLHIFHLLKINFCFEIGGTSMLPGFQHRLFSELRVLVAEEERYQQVWSFFSLLSSSIYKSEYVCVSSPVPLHETKRFDWFEPNLALGIPTGGMLALFFLFNLAVAFWRDFSCRISNILLLLQLTECEFKLHKLPTHPNLASWLGAAIYGSLEIFQQKSVTKEYFIQVSFTG